MTLTLAAQLPASIGTDLWDIQIPPVEKIIRTVLVYVAIVAIIRVAGKRLMAQMNSLDLVVVLLLSNVVQNAIIGDDNSITGGVIGAIVLVVVNAAAERIAQVWPAFRTFVEGRPTVVVRDGALIEGSLDIRKIPGGSQRTRRPSGRRSWENISTKLSASAFNAAASMRWAPSLAISVSGSETKPGWRSRMIVLSSFITEFSSPPRYCAVF